MFWILHVDTETEVSDYNEVFCRRQIPWMASAVMSLYAERPDGSGVYIEGIIWEFETQMLRTKYLQLLSQCMKRKKLRRDV